MNLKNRIIFAFSLLSLLSISSASAGIALYEKDDFKIVFGGFVETDIFSDTTRSFTEVVGNGAAARPGTFDGDNNRTQFSLRNSRLFFDIGLPPEAEWKTRAYFEFDFLGFDPGPSAAALNTESGYSTNPTLRMRHAYLGASNNGYTVLVGQTWTLFGWVPAYVPTTASVPPVAGTLYERTPQVTVIKAIPVGDSDALQAGISVTRPVQRDSGVPGLDAGLRFAANGRKSGYMSPSGERKAEPMSIALSGTAREIASPPLGGDQTQLIRQLGSAFAVNGMLPILASADGKEIGNTLSLAGEFTRGSGYGDEFNGWSGNLSPTVAAANTPNLDAGLGGFDANGTFTLVKLQTWNVQIQYHLPASMAAFANIGYGQLKSSNLNTLTPATGKVGYDKAEVYFLNLFHDFTSHVRVAMEADHFVTNYIDGNRAKDNRFQVSTWVRF